MKQIIFLIASGLVLYSCAGNSTKKDVKSTDESAVLNEVQTSEKSSDNSKPHPGQAVFESYCLACHQTDGSGVPGMYPPLSPNKYVKDKDKMIQIVLNGLKGEIEVDGEVYDNLMAPHKQLSDKDLANVISYVRSHFGNDLEPVTEVEIAAARNW